MSLYNTQNAIEQRLNMVRKMIRNLEKCLQIIFRYLPNFVANSSKLNSQTKTHKQQNATHLKMSLRCPKEKEELVPLRRRMCFGVSGMEATKRITRNSRVLIIRSHTIRQLASS